MHFPNRILFSCYTCLPLPILILLPFFSLEQQEPSGRTSRRDRGFGAERWAAPQSGQQGREMEEWAESLQVSVEESLVEGMGAGRLSHC